MTSTYKDKKVLIFGLGLNDGGLGMTQFFLKEGAKVTITDGKTYEQLEGTLKQLGEDLEKVTLRLEGHIKEDFIENDIIVRNPAIKSDNEWLEIARENGKEIIMEMALFHKLCPCPIIGITGTRGKSTTTTLAYKFLESYYGDKILLGGNIGKSAVRELDQLNKDNLAVLEISSFQLDGMGESKVSPHVALVTNIYPDHLNWHKDMDDYINAKKQIFLNQSLEDYLIVNIDNDITREFVNEAKGTVYTFSLEDIDADYYMNKETLEISEDGEVIFKIENLILDGTHNLYNILGAFVISRIYDIPLENIQKVLGEFKGVEGREELIREIDGIRFYNDTTATSIEAMLSMFERFGEKNKGKIVMISGGVDKGLDYTRVKEPIEMYVKSLVLLEGSASEKIKECLEGVDIHSYYSNFTEAIDKAYEVAEKGDMVILCPGGSSFNMFANEFDRGRQYVDYVNSL